MKKRLRVVYLLFIAGLVVFAANSFVAQIVRADGGSPNVSLSPISDVVVTSGNFATFTAAATDTDASATIAYGLSSDAPSSSTIDPSTGIFSWDTSGAATGTYDFSVTATGSSGGSASASTSIEVDASEAVVQTPTSTPAQLIVGSATGTPSSSVVLPINFVPGTTGVASMQFDLEFPSGITYSSVAAGDAANAIGAFVTGGNSGTASTTILAAGFLGDFGAGDIADTTVYLPAGIAPGQYNIVADNLLFSADDATAVSSTSVMGTITVLGTADTTSTSTSTPITTSSSTPSSTLSSASSTPTIDLFAIPSSTVASGNFATFTAAATDTDASATIAYGLSSDAPSSSTIDPSTGIFSWDTSGAATGTYDFSVTATGSSGGSASASTSIEVDASEGSTAQLSFGDATSSPGSTAVLPVTFVSGTADVGSLQFDLALPAGITYSSITSPDLAEGGVSGNSTTTILISNIGQPIASGTIGQITVNLPSDISLGQYDVMPIDAVLADTENPPQEVSVVTASGTLTIVAPPAQQSTSTATSTTSSGSTGGNVGANSSGETTTSGGGGGGESAVSTSDANSVISTNNSAAVPIATTTVTTTTQSILASDQGVVLGASTTNPGAITLAYMNEFENLAQAYVTLQLASSCSFSFAHTLSQGMTNPEVKNLQIALNATPLTQVASTGAGSPGNETDYFGPATKHAVMLFQNIFAQQILIPQGLTTATGYVGSATTALLNQLCTER